MMSYVDLDRGDCVVFEGTIPAFAWRDWGKSLRLH